MDKMVSSDKVKLGPNTYIYLEDRLLWLQVHSCREDGAVHSLSANVNGAVLRAACLKLLCPDLPTVIVKPFNLIEFDERPPHYRYWAWWITSNTQLCNKECNTRRYYTVPKFRVEVIKEKLIISDCLHSESFHYTELAQLNKKQCTLILAFLQEHPESIT